MKRLFLSTIAAAVITMIIPVNLDAQDARGTILGRVTDPSGAAIFGADIRATNTGTGVLSVAKTNEAGNYTIPYLVSGVYRLEVDFSGFKKFVRENIEVRVGDTLPIDVGMQIGAATETVEVTAETPLLQAAEATLGGVVNERQLTELPSWGGGVFGRAYLATGVSNTIGLRTQYVGTPSGQSGWVADGVTPTYSKRSNNEFSIDGVSDTITGTIVMIPPQTSVAEMKVQTATYDASTGHAMGATVNVNIKNGTNDVHGEAHLVVRNSAWDAKTIVQNRENIPVAKVRDNRWGWSAGGPVFLPRLYNGRDKTHWYYNYETNYVTSPADLYNTVPTAAMRTGDLSALRLLGSTYQIYDPLTTRAAANGRFQRDPFANNLIPASRIDPVAKNLLNYYPLPNRAGNADGRQNFFVNYEAPLPVNTHLARFDHAFSTSHRIYFRLMKEYFWSETARSFGQGNNNNGQRYDLNQRSVAFDDVYILNPTFFVNLRYGFSQRAYTYFRNSQGLDLATLGFSPNFLKMLPNSADSVLPMLSLGYLTGLGSGLDSRYSAFMHSLTGNFTKTHRDHSFRFGAEFRLDRMHNRTYTNDISPRLSFDSVYTRGPFDNSTAPTVAGEYASFLLGIPAGFVDKSASVAEQGTFWGLYFQDDFKVTSKLTLNLGLRYERESPMTERFNRSVLGFAFDQSSPIEAQARANYALNPMPGLSPDQFRVRGGLTFAGVNGNPRELWPAGKGNLNPRVGLAYQLFPKTVLRAGYGIFYDLNGISSRDAIQYGFSQSTPIQASMDSGLTYIASTANPFPNGLFAAPGASKGLSTYLGQGVSFFENPARHGYAQRWSFGFQQLLPAQFMAEATYVGNRSTRLPVSRNLNALATSYLSTSATRDQATINYLSESFLNPFYGTDPIYGRNISRSGLLAAYPQFGSVSVYQPIGYSWYHALQMRGERRFSRGVMFTLGYTWSKMMAADSFLNAGDPRPYEELAAQDRTHRLSLTGVWELPFGRSRRFGGNMPKVLDCILGGWQFNGVIVRQSGAPLEWGDVWTLFTGNPDDVKLAKGERNLDRWFNINAGFNRNSSQQLASNRRVSPRRFSDLRADEQSRWDLSLIKNFKLVERVTLQVRAEAINALNHPILTAPTMSPTSSTFGSTTGQEGPRGWYLSGWLKF